MLPRKFEPFPEHMYGKPLEEIDTFIYEEVSTAAFNIPSLSAASPHLAAHWL